MNSNIIILVANFGVGLLLIIIVAIVHSKKRKKNEKQFLKNWPLIEESISENNFSDVCYFTKEILLNQNGKKSNQILKDFFIVKRY